MQIRKIHGVDRSAVIQYLMVHGFDDDGGYSINAWAFSRSVEPANETGCRDGKILVERGELLASIDLVSLSVFLRYFSYGD